MKKNKKNLANLFSIYKIVIVVIIVLSFIRVLTPAFAQDTEADTTAYVGEIFGTKVSRQNYNFARAGIVLFGNKWGRRPKTAGELDKLVWEHLILSFIAFNQDITVPQEDVHAEISRTLAAEQAGFDWREDPGAYEQWVRRRTNVSTAVFEGEIRHMMQIERLRRQMLKSISAQIEVSSAEAREKFLREYNSLSVELIEFEQLRDAEEFFKQVKRNTNLWKKEKKRNPERFKRPGFVSLEFLIDLWGFPAEAAFAMMRRNSDDFYPPRPIYEGYAVFKILEKRPADESLFPGREQAYRDKVREIKAQQGLRSWIDQLTRDAGIRIYSPAEGEANSPPAH
ncbi:MAG: hypothetical protein MJA29_06905 [Candidatus Omnitrophica bacterium]|nr:hypothetical protein [Candidatus Omnitrophota bacterium]